MSDTPRCDIWAVQPRGNKSLYDDALDFARTLERELSALRADHEQIQSCANVLRRERDELQAVVQGLADAVVLWFSEQEQFSDKHVVFQKMQASLAAAARI